MNRMQVSVAGLMVAILLIGSGIVQKAEAEVRFSATLSTPNVRVRVGNTPAVHYRTVRIKRLPIHGRFVYRLSKQDRDIAHRLALFTGVPAREMLQLRSYGYQWFEIGNWLRLPRSLVRAALHRGTWKRFLKEQQMLARGGRPYYDGRMVVYYIDD